MSHPLGANAHFVTTQWELVLQSAHAAPAEALPALDQLCRSYWGPLHAYVRRCGHSPEDAADLTQGFFQHLLGSEAIHRLRPERGRFRFFLLVALKNFLANRRDWARAHKRGGNHDHISFDTVNESSGTPEARLEEESFAQLFDRDWAVSILERASGKLGATWAEDGKAAQFEQLKSFLVQPGIQANYRAAGEALAGLAGTTAVTAGERSIRSGRL